MPAIVPACTRLPGANDARCPLLHVALVLRCHTRNRADPGVKVIEPICYANDQCHRRFRLTDRGCVTGQRSYRYSGSTSAKRGPLRADRRDRPGSRGSCAGGSRCRDTRAPGRRRPARARRRRRGCPRPRRSRRRRPARAAAPRGDESSVISAAVLLDDGVPGGGQPGSQIAPGIEQVLVDRVAVGSRAGPRARRSGPR